MTPPSRTDVVVIGAGVIGAATAWRLRQRGLQVSLVDPAPGRGASWAAAGMLAPVTEVHFGEEALLHLNLESSARWPAFARELHAASGHDPGLHRCGTVAVARDRDDRAALDRLAAFQSELGLDVERLTSRQVRRLEPGLAPTVTGGLLVPGDHQVDNRALVVALLAACERTGVDLLRARAIAITSSDREVTGVRVADGTEIRAPQVVVAAGAGGGALDGLPTGTVPVRPVKGQLLHLRGPRRPALASRVIRGLEVYVVPRPDGRVVVGATVEERGEDRRVTAGGVLDLLRAAYELVPGLTELEFVEATAGLRPGTVDNAPLLGPGPIPGLTYATGHYRNGILLTPVTADATAELVATGTAPDVIAAFSPQRTSPDAVGRP